MIYSEYFVSWMISLEGFIPYVYDDADSFNPRRDWEASDKKGYPTFGVGHLLTKGDDYLRKYTRANPASSDFVRELFSKDISSYALAVKNSVKRVLFPYQYDALISLAYNIGSTGFSNSVVCAEVNKGNLSGDRLKQAFNNWVKSKGVKNLTLVDRRAIEFKLFTTGVYSTYNGKPFLPVKK